MRTAKYSWRQAKNPHQQHNDESDEVIVVTRPVVRERVSRYGNRDLYSPPDAASRSADIETKESLAAKDYDNKIPLKLTPEQIESLVDFVKDKPIFYDKKENSWINKSERLSLLQLWAQPEGLNGKHTYMKFKYVSFETFVISEFPCS